MLPTRRRKATLNSGSVKNGTMQPKTKTRLLIFGLVIPYLALVMYFALRIQEHPLPAWLPYFGLSYLLGTMILVIILSRRFSRSAPKQTIRKPNRVVQWALRGWAAYLVVIWSVGFLWGAYQTITGRVVWQRSVPAGAFLLAFIALFSRFLYTDMKRRIDPVTADAKNNSVQGDLRNSAS
jgi:hypothetical protein